MSTDTMENAIAMEAEAILGLCSDNSRDGRRCPECLGAVDTRRLAQDVLLRGSPQGVP
jgi:hypothetical protein